MMLYILHSKLNSIIKNVLAAKILDVRLRTCVINNKSEVCFSKEPVDTIKFYMDNEYAILIYSNHWLTNFHISILHNKF